MATAGVVSKLMGGDIGGVDSEVLGTFPSRCQLMPRVVLSLSAQHHHLEENVMPEDEVLITDIVNKKLVCVLPYCLTTQSHLKIPKFDSVRLGTLDIQRPYLPRSTTLQQDHWWPLLEWG